MPAYFSTISADAKFPRKKAVEIAECDVSVFPIIAFAVNVSLWKI